MPGTASNSELNQRIPRARTLEESWMYDADDREKLPWLCDGNSTPAAAPVATGFPEVVMCDENVDSNVPAFGARAIVVGPDGKVVDVVEHANTVPNDSMKYATVPEGSHPYRCGRHRGKYHAPNLGAFADDGTFGRRIPLGRTNPNTATRYIAMVRTSTMVDVRLPPPTRGGRRAV